MKFVENRYKYHHSLGGTIASISHSSLLNSKQVLIHKMLVGKTPFDQIRPLILQQHARLHTQGMSESEDWSHQDEIREDMPEAWMRIVPQGEDHSIAWLLWHMTLCEDITMNMLVLMGGQVLTSEGWLDDLNILWCDTGNAMSSQEIIDFSQDINIDVLLMYRCSVGKSTQEMIKHIKQGELYRRVDPADIQRLFDEGAVVEEAKGIAEY